MTPTYQVVRTADGFKELKADWNALLRDSRICTPFLTWEWMYTWWQRYGQGKGDRHLAIVVARQQERLVAILPGYVRRRLGISTFAFLGTEFESTDYLRAIEVEGKGAPALPGLIAHLLKDEPGIDVLELSNVLASDPTVAALESFAQASGASCDTKAHRVCPYVDVAAIGGWETFLSARTSSMRAKVRRCMRRLAEAGAEFDWVRDRAEVRAAVAELFALHAKRFTAKQADSIFRAELRQPFHEDVSELFFDQDVLRLFRIRVKGKTISALYCFKFAGGLFYFQAGSDPDWEEHSVGLVVIGHAIQYAFEQRLEIFDFMRGGESYKFRWTDTSRELVVTRLGVSVKGRAALAFQRHGLTAKGMVKRLIRRPPVSVPQAATS